MKVKETLRYCNAHDSVMSSCLTLSNEGVHRLHISRTQAGQPANGTVTVQSLLRIRLFSTMDVRDVNGFSRLPKSRKARGVLAVLAMNAGRPVTREELAALLWSRREREQARSSLRQVVHELGELLGGIDPGLFLVDRTHLALGNLYAARKLTDLVWVDTHALSPGEATGSVRPEFFQQGLVEDLLGMDPAFDRWRKVQAERLFGLARGRAENRLTCCQRPDGTEAGDAARLLLRIDPAHERAWQAVIRGHLASGDATAAIYAYERCADALASAGLGAPSDETRTLLAELGTRSAQGVPGPASSTPQPVRIGVMPLCNLDGAPASEFSLGLAAEITYALSGVSWLSCVGPGTLVAATLPQTAPPVTPRKFLAPGFLKLDFLVEGTVQRADGRVRVMIRLLDLHAGEAIVFAKRLDCAETELLSLQETIVAETVAPMHAVLAARSGMSKRSLA
jgi:DNA-binding SARP family transcriptional activator